MLKRKRRYFGTDGIRGPYGGPVINSVFAARLGGAVAQFLKRNQLTTSTQVLIGRDTRAGGWELEQGIATGLRGAGLQPMTLGIVPTPAVAASVMQQGAALGVMITASHNPASDNGIKFFGPSGMKLSDDQELEIEDLLPDEAWAMDFIRAAQKSDEMQPGPRTGWGPGLPKVDGLEVYLAKMRKLLAPKSLQGWRIVLDTANGSTCVSSPIILRELGAEIKGIGNEPDGRNINANVGSEHPATMAALVRGWGARIGIAHDGDGDRCVLCDETGNVLDGDEILTILALHALKRRRLVKNTLVVTIQSNLGVDAAVKAAGGQVVRSAVGDRYVSEKMLETGAMLGGESSGHVISAEISRAGDGLAAALMVIDVILSTGRPLSELRKGLVKFPQGTRNLRVREKRELSTLTRLKAEITALEQELGDQGRVLVRYSGTEAKLRLLVEGPTDVVVEAGLSRLEAAVRQELEVL